MAKLLDVHSVNPQHLTSFVGDSASPDRTRITIHPNLEVARAVRRMSSLRRGFLFSVALLYLILAMVTPQSSDAQSSCSTMPTGLFLQRWNDLDGRGGPLGSPTGPEVSVPGRSGRQMPFEHGEIVFSPDQGSAMLVAAYQQDDNLIVNWSDTAPFNYDKFIVRWDLEGVNVGQFDVDSYIDRTNGFSRIRPLLPGRYTVMVEGCDIGTGGSTCRQGFTVPVNAQYALPPIPVYAGCKLALQPGGFIGERWARVGGGEGPIGCPPRAERPGR